MTNQHTDEMREALPELAWLWHETRTGKCLKDMTLRETGEYIIELEASTTRYQDAMREAAVALATCQYDYVYNGQFETRIQSYNEDAVEKSIITINAILGDKA